MAGQSIRILPDEFTKEQHHRVGISVPDQWNRLWTYCMFPAGTYNAGELLRDSVAADLLGTYGTSEPNVTHTISEAAEVGSNVLKDTTAELHFRQVPTRCHRCDRGGRGFRTSVPSAKGTGQRT